MPGCTMHTGGLTLHTAMSSASLFNASLFFCSLLAPSPLAIINGRLLLLCAALSPLLPHAPPCSALSL